MPQRQAPFAHVSASAGLHAVQAPPPVPQAERPAGRQLLPLQQPLGQLWALQPAHAPLLQGWPLGQATHRAPPEPHAALSVPTWQMALAQQPAQDMPSQTQAPPEQRCPCLQPAFMPQAQLPLVQRSARLGSQAAQLVPPVPQLASEEVWQPFWASQQPLQLMASHTHCPFMQRWPALHAAPTPQRQLPAAQVSESWAPHARQTLPPVPQLDTDGGMHWLLNAQQPAGQLIASHTQVPLAHRWPIAHAPLLPQAQAPPTQPLARTGSQAVQAPPPTPQLAALGIWQTP